MSEERITALEEAIAHQGHTIEELSGELARQSQAVQLLQKQVKALAERFLALEETTAAPAESKPPPHW